MATYTSNYNLEKPDYNDRADIGAINSNMDKIDAKMKEIENNAGTGGGSNVEWNQIQTTGSKIAEVTIDGTTTEVYAPSESGGGVDIESEVIDIRLKADGTTATSAGNAVREQVAALKGDLSNFKNGLSNLFYKEYCGDNWYWNDNGIKVYDETMRNSSLIPVNNVVTVNFGKPFMYCFLTANLQLVKSGGIYNDVPQIVKIQVPSNAFYIVVSWWKTTGYVSEINTIAKDIIYVTKDGSGDFDNLLLATLKAYKKGSRVVVEKGDYDIKQEFKDVFGEDFFFNYTQQSRTGIILRNNITYQFSPLANVHFEYENNGNGNVYDIFSPFNAGKWGFTLEGLNISSKNSKYCVHDERGEYLGTEGYYNRYINCNMYLDNSENTRMPTTQCIGGGLGTNGHIYIDGCIFDTEDSPTCIGDSKQTVSYHNDLRGDTKSFISITNCYFKEGTIAILPYGTSPKPTEALISGNSLKSDIIHGTSDVDNIIIYAMNNEIRSN